MEEIECTENNWISVMKHLWIEINLKNLILDYFYSVFYFQENKTIMMQQDKSLVENLKEKFQKTCMNR